MASPLKTIAIADDEQGVVAILQAIVTDLGYECVGIAHDGMEAVELVRRTKPNVLLMDFHMPLLDGLEATRQIIALAHTAVVVLTAETNPEIGRKAMDLGACGYMQKPFDTRQIAAIIESAWHRFQTVFSLQEQTRQLNEALELRKLTEKAKGILMEQQGFGEEEAHRCLLKMSQDQGITLKEVCRSVIQVRMVLGRKAVKKAA